MAGYSRLLVAALLLVFSAAAVASDIAVRGERIYPVSGAPIDNGVVIIRDGRVAVVGSADDVPVPDGMTVIDAAVVTPGLIDAHTVVGLAGYLNQPHDQDQIERSEAIQPELRAIDAYNTREALITWLREFGVTTIHTGHGPGEIISGQTLIAKTTGDTIAEAVFVPAAMVAATLGEGVLVPGDTGRLSPGSRSKAAAMLRTELLGAQTYLDKQAAADGDDDKEPPARDLRKEALAEVLNGNKPLLVTVHRHHDILTALRIASEFGIRLVLDGAAESYLVLDEIKAAGVPVIVHPSMARAGGERENLSFTSAGELMNAGIPVAFQSGFESYVPKTRVVLFEAAQTLPHGVSFDQALAAVTIEAARILGIADRVGSIEPGKDGDLALYDGDPFEYTSHAIGTIIEGVRVSDTVK
ncbi:MAG: amidohydrolase family protein [Woeseiaceae bacterium]|nr:amidohydrolase family protein [Woeseiaceae bacterium]